MIVIFTNILPPRPQASWSRIAPRISPHLTAKLLDVRNRAITCIKNSLISVIRISSSIMLSRTSRYRGELLTLVQRGDQCHPSLSLTLAAAEPIQSCVSFTSSESQTTSTSSFFKGEAAKERRMQCYCLARCYMLGDALLAPGSKNSIMGLLVQNMNEAYLCGRANAGVRYSRLA
jgi:hypothetical protein